jgi:integrase
MAKSINVVFIKQGKDQKDGSVYVRTIENSIVRKKSLKIKLTQTQWDNYFNEDTQRFRSNKSFPKSEEYNNIIHLFLQKLDSVGNDVELLPDHHKSFLKFWLKYIDTTENHGTKIKHEVVFNKLIKYLKTIHKTDNIERVDLLFKDITPFFIREMRLYLKQIKDPKGLSNNSVNHYLKVIKSIINYAQEDGYYTYLINPFTSITFSHERKEKKVLNEDELRLLQNTIITDSNIDLARKMFLFELFSNGMRISDILILRWNNLEDRRLKYKMFKTDELISIPINLNMSLILNDMLGKENRYVSILDNYKKEFIEDGKVIEITIREVDERLSKISIKEDQLLPNDKIKLKKDSKTSIIDEYYFNVKNEIAFMNLWKFRVEFLKEIDLVNLGGLMGAINKVKEPTNFIFPILNNNLFKNIDSHNDFSKITMVQYKRIKHATIVYNRKLKKVGELCNIETKMSSHVSRHSFTNLLLNMDNVNLYDISQSLGHKNITITQNYIQSGFNNKKIDYLNKDLDNKHRKKF